MKLSKERLSEIAAIKDSDIDYSDIPELDDALAAAFPPLDIHFIDNTDPAGIDLILDRQKTGL